MAFDLKRPCSPAALALSRCGVAPPLRPSSPTTLPLRPLSLNLSPARRATPARPVSLAMTPPQRITPSPRPPSPAPVSRSSLTPPPTLSRRNSFTARPVTPPPQPPSPGVYRSPYHRLSASPPAHRPPSSSSSRSISPTSTRSSPITPARPILEVHGDSFCGVFTLLGKRASVYKYKGASARVCPLFPLAKRPRPADLVNRRASTTLTRRCKSAHSSSTDSSTRDRNPFCSCLAPSTSPSTSSGVSRLLWARKTGC